MAKNFARTGKWEDRYIGPYQVIEQHEGGAYSLREPTGETMKGRFTVEQLKPVDHYRNPGVEAGKPLEFAQKKNSENFEVSRVLSHRETEDGSYEYLVRWKGFHKDEDSWIPYSDFNMPRPVKAYWKRIAADAKTTKKSASEMTRPTKQTTFKGLTKSVGGSDVMSTRTLNTRSGRQTIPPNRR
jgi:hypothetical protein